MCMDGKCCWVVPYRVAALVVGYYLVLVGCLLLFTYLILTMVEMFSPAGSEENKEPRDIAKDIYIWNTVTTHVVGGIFGGVLLAGIYQEDLTVIRDALMFGCCFCLLTFFDSIYPFGLYSVIKGSLNLAISCGLLSIVYFYYKDLESYF